MTSVSHTLQKSRMCVVKIKTVSLPLLTLTHEKLSSGILTSNSFSLQMTGQQNKFKEHLSEQEDCKGDCTGHIQPYCDELSLKPSKPSSSTFKIHINNCSSFSGFHFHILFYLIFSWFLPTLQGFVILKLIENRFRPAATYIKQ